LNGFDSLQGAKLRPASSDASFRRYFRIQSDGNSYIAMDAPPPNEDCRPFASIAGYLESMGLNCPSILGADFERGFVLMTDLGSTQYLDELRRKPDAADLLYADAMNALLRLRKNGEAYQQHLPDYDAEFVAFELGIFREWFCERHLALDFSATDEAQWQDCCEILISNAMRQEKVFMHRDFHSRNLMLTDDNNPGILDFQDAVEGPLTYDLVSLLKDCYIKWPVDKVNQWAVEYYDRLDSDCKSQMNVEDFLKSFDLTGLQRHLKAVGIFARLFHRDGKSAYLDDIPLTLSYIGETAARYAELDFIADLVSNRVLPALHRSD
jgi:aminoglycoside/choline kinase family phosphotransferase